MTGTQNFECIVGVKEAVDYLADIGRMLGGVSLSRREALFAANVTENQDSPDVIHFNISGKGPHPIKLRSSLPTIIDAVVIDGSSEPDFDGTPLVALLGDLAGKNVNGLVGNKLIELLMQFHIKKMSGFGEPTIEVHEEFGDDEDKGCVETVFEFV